MFRTSVAAAFILLAAPVPVFAGGGLQVQPVSGTTFDVLYSNNANIHDFWCAAGSYAARKLGARSTTRVYRISEPPRRAGQGIRFSLDPAGAASRTELNVIGEDDGSLSVGSAKNQCEVARQMREER
jgi:hypothetical protein